MSTANIELTSACYARTPIEGTNALREMGLCGKLNIRGDISHEQFVQGVVDTTGITPSSLVNSVQERESNSLFCLGPNEWLLHCDLTSCPDIAKSIEQHFDGIHAAVTDVSDYYTLLRLRGPDSIAILSRGCPLDLHPSVFQSGDATQTRFGHASVLLHKLGDGESWDVQVRWSYAEYVWDYLVSAMGTV